MFGDSGVDFAILDAAPALKRGEQHPAVAEAQGFLERYGYLPEGAAQEGVIDAATAEALAAYQRFHSLPETGEFEPVVRDLMLCPRCGVPDLNRGIAFSIETPLDHLDLTFAFGKGTTDIDGYQEFDAVRRAFGTWAATGHFALHDVTINENPDFRIDWIAPDDPGYPFHVGDGILATGTLPSQPSQPPQRLTFNDWWNWNLLAYSFFAIDTETVALHEIGHLLGLNHSTVPGSVMWPEYDGDTEHRTLSADDRAGLDALYGTRPTRLASAVIFSVRQHFGNGPADLPGVSVGAAKDYEFVLPGIDVNGPAYLLFQARAVSYELNVFTVNGQPIPGGVPVTSGEAGWAGQVMLVSPHMLKPANNVLHVEARNDSGGTGGDIDNFVLDNAVVLYSTIQPGLFLRPRAQPGFGLLVGGARAHEGGLPALPE